MSRIALIPVSCKPFHVGHDALIRLACSECDEAIVFVSTVDRVRKGEFPIKFNTMRKLWDEVILESLPDNMILQFVPNPVIAVYAFIGVRNMDPLVSSESLVIYSDTEDMDHNFPESNMVKYSATLVKERKIIRRHVPRNTTVNVSGTQMRAWLMHGNKERFFAHLPCGMDGEAVWSALVRR